MKVPPGVTAGQTVQIAVAGVGPVTTQEQMMAKEKSEADKARKEKEQREKDKANRPGAVGGDASTDPAKGGKTTPGTGTPAQPGRKDGKGEEKMAKATCGEGKTGRRHVWRKQTCVCACVCVCVTRLC